MSELPELYWSPTQGLVGRCVSGDDEGTLIGLKFDRRRRLGGEVPADAVRLAAGRLAAELPLIPGSYRFQRDRVVFVTYEDGWHLLGPTQMLPVGHLVFVDRYADDTNQEVLVGVHVAERTVRHGDGKAVTYAIAKIDKGGN